MAVLLLCATGFLRGETTLFTLNDLFDLADKNSKSLKPHITNVSVAEEQVKNMRNACMPDINLDLSVAYIGDGQLIERDFSSAINAPMPHFGNNASLEITQVLYAGGALLAANEIAKLEMQGAEISLEKQRQILYYRILGQYIDLYKMHNLIGIYDQNIDLTKQVIDQMKLKDDEGIVLNNDVTRYELLLKTLELSKLKIENGIETLNHNIITLVGLGDDVRIMPDSNLVNRILPCDGETHWIEQSTNNLQLKELSTNMNISDKAIKAENAKRIPSIVFFAQDNFNGPVLIEVPPINQNFNYWMLGVGIQYKFGELYKSKHSVQRARMNHRKMQELYDSAKEEIEMEIRANYIKYIEAYDEMLMREKSVQLAHENYDVVKNRYENELALITDMLDASTAKLSAEMELVNAKIDIVFNYYKLQFNIGNLK